MGDGLEFSIFLFGVNLEEVPHRVAGTIKNLLEGLKYFQKKFMNIIEAGFNVHLNSIWIGRHGPKTKNKKI